MLNCILHAKQSSASASKLSDETGARALRSIMENIMLDVMYDLPALNEHVRVTISAAVVRGKGKAKITPLPTSKRDAA